MTNDEFHTFLEALARKHLNYRKYFEAVTHTRELHPVLDQLTRLSQLLKIVIEDDDRELLRLLIGRLHDSVQVEHAIAIMERPGLLDAIDEDPRTLFSEIRISALPAEDAEFLRDAGHKHPEADLILIAEYSRKRFGEDRRQERLPSEVIQDTPDVVKQALTRLESQTETPRLREEKKRRKILNGVGKVLTGSILGVGNILVGAGSIISPNPAVAAGVIASGALAVGSICQGLGDLRGE
jgi:hypothetical protein